MGYEINFMGIQKFLINNPRRILNNFIDPLTMTQRFCPFRFIKHCHPLFRVCQGVITNSNYQMDIWEQFFDLFK